MEWQAAADALIEARRTEVGLTALPLIPSTMAEAVLIQRAVMAGMGPIGGWKVGASSPDGPPNCAPLLASGIGAGAARHGMVEAEIALVLGHDLPAREAPYLDSEIMAAIASAHPTIEVLQPRFAGEPDVWSGLADSGGHAGLVLGDAIPAWAEIDFEVETVELRVAGSVVKTGQGNPGGLMLRLLRWLADTGARWDGGLRAGQVVTTGSWTGKDLVRVGETVEARFAQCGVVRL